MPRDISGNYTLPAGNPVVTGTIIDAGWANPTLSDIATQLNGVLTRDGVLAPTAPIRFTDGSASAPSLSFAAAAATGFYRSGTTVGVAVSGTARFTFDGPNFAFTLIPDSAGTARLQVPSSAKLQLGVNTGSAFTVDSDNKMYRGATISTDSAAQFGYLGVPRFFQNGGTLTRDVVGRMAYDNPVVNYTINTGVFVAGDSFWIYNYSSSSNISVIPGSGVTLIQASTGGSGTQTIGPRGIAFVHAVSSTEFVLATNKLKRDKVFLTSSQIGGLSHWGNIVVTDGTYSPQITASNFPDGTWCYFYNASPSAVTITQGSGTALYTTGTGTPGNRTIQINSMAFVYGYGGGGVTVTGVGVS